MVLHPGAGLQDVRHVAIRALDEPGKKVAGALGLLMVVDDLIETKPYQHAL